MAEQLRTYRRTKTLQMPGWARWLAFSLAVLAILALIAVLLPGAQVELDLPRQHQISVLTLTARESLTRPDLIDGIPLHKVVGEVSAQIDQKTSGTISVGDEPAGGYVTFTNLTDDVQEIPAGTVVRSLEPALRFEVKKAGSLPAGPGTTITLPVAEMDGSGPQGNLPAGNIVAVDPPLGQFLSVSNPQALSGGTLTTVPALAAADLQAGNDALDQALRQAFQEQVKAEVPELIYLIATNIVVQDVRSESTTPPYDLPLETLQISKTVEMSGYYFLYSDLQEWSNLAFDASLPPGTVGIADSVDFDQVIHQYLPDSSAQIKLIASIQTIPIYDAKAIAAQVSGLKPEEAIKLIKDNLVPGSQPVITLSPAWWRWLPFFPQRIDIHG